MKTVIVPDDFSRPWIQILCGFMSVLFSMQTFPHFVTFNLYSCPSTAGTLEHFVYLLPVDTSKSRLLLTIYIAFLYTLSSLIIILSCSTLLCFETCDRVNRARHYSYSDDMSRISESWRLCFVTLLITYINLVILIINLLKTSVNQHYQVFLMQKQVY